MSKAQTKRIDPKIIERGKRVQRLVKLTGLKQKEFLEKHGIAPTTFNQWAHPKLHGLSKSGANLLIDCVRKEGVECQFSWLYDGVNPPPRVVAFSESSQELLEEHRIDQNTSLKHEIELFENTVKDALVIQIKDEGMLPLLEPGTFVGGSKIQLGDKILTLPKPQACIVEIDEEKYIVRLVKQGSKQGLYSLEIINETAVTLAKVIQDIRPISITPITRMWRNAQSI